MWLWNTEFHNHIENQIENQEDFLFLFFPQNPLDQRKLVNKFTVYGSLSSNLR